METKHDLKFISVSREICYNITIIPIIPKYKIYMKISTRFTNNLF